MTGKEDSKGAREVCPGSVSAVQGKSSDDPTFTGTGDQPTVLGPSCLSFLRGPSHGTSASKSLWLGIGRKRRGVGYLAGVESLIYSSPQQGSNGTFWLSLEGPDAEAFSVSPERAAGSVEVQVLVKTPSQVDYEQQMVMWVQVRGALGHQGGSRPWGSPVPMPLPLSTAILRWWPRTRSARTPPSPW